MATFRSKIFFPARLPIVQQRIIYRRKNHALLTGDEPATVAIGDEVLQMHPINRMQDEPGMDTSLAEIKRLMRESRNYWNLAPFLTGCRTSKRVVKGTFVEQVVKHACDSNNEKAIMECLRQVNKTGLKLWHYNIAETLMRRAVWLAVLWNWDKGLYFADTLWIMMQDPKHIQPGLPNPTCNPIVVGMMVQLYASKAIMLQGQQDTPGNVITNKAVEYTQRLLSLWDKLNFDMVKGRNIQDDLLKADHSLLKWAPIWHGMIMARKVSGVTKEMREELGVRVKEVASALETAQKFLQDTPRPGPIKQRRGYNRRGVKLYEKLSSISS